MFIQNTPQTNTFKSINSPIIAETISSRFGQVTIREIGSKELTEVAKIFRSQDYRNITASLWGAGRKKIQEARDFYASISKGEMLKEAKEYLICQ